LQRNICIILIGQKNLQQYALYHYLRWLSKQDILACFTPYTALSGLLFELSFLTFKEGQRNDKRTALTFLAHYFYSTIVECDQFFYEVQSNAKATDEPFIYVGGPIKPLE